MSRLASVARASVGEQAANTLREAILRAELGPGEPLREVALADDLHVSRNTVREALRILEAERLVEYHLHRGVLVAPVRVEGGYVTAYDHTADEMPGSRSCSRSQICGRWMQSFQAVHISTCCLSRQKNPLATTPCSRGVVPVVMFA